MKRTLLIASFAVSVALLGGCALPGAATTTTTGTVATTTSLQKLQALAVTVNNNCQVGQPFLLSVLAMQTDPNAVAVMQKVIADAGQICSVAGTIANPPIGTTTTPTLDLATVKTFVNSEIPVLLNYVAASNLNSTQKTAAELAITGAQFALNQAVVAAQ